MAVLLVDCYGIPEHCLHKSLWCSYLHILTDVIGNMTPDAMACFECRALLPHGEVHLNLLQIKSQKSTFPSSINSKFSTILIILKFCVGHGRHIAILCSKILNILTSATNVMDKQYFMISYLEMNLDGFPLILPSWDSWEWYPSEAILAVMHLLIIHKGTAICGKIPRLWWGEEVYFS